MDLPTMDLPKLPHRDPQSHKGTFGRALVVGGSRGMAGAVALAGMSATRSGAGLTTLAVPSCCLETVASFDPNYMTVPLPSDPEGKISHDALGKLLELSARATSMGLGPGLATSEALTQIVEKLYREFTGPMIVDADGLNALARAPGTLANARGPRVLTPHLGEFRRLTRGTEFEPAPVAAPGDCDELAIRFAAKHGVVVVLKGHNTLVTDGTFAYRNTSGNAGMATGGAGDVLTGVITALLGQGLTPPESAVLSVYLHGVAGDLARDAKGEVSMTASDIKDHLCGAFLRAPQNVD